jgi:septal ring factor EnvC (AmiA/AmiB activator)
MFFFNRKLKQQIREAEARESRIAAKQQQLSELSAAIEQAKSDITDLNAEIDCLQKALNAHNN